MKAFTIQELDTHEQRTKAALLFQKELNARWNEKLLPLLKEKFIITEEIQEDKTYLTAKRHEKAQEISGAEFKPKPMEIACFPTAATANLAMEYPPLFGEHGLRIAYNSLERQLLFEVITLAVVKDAIDSEHSKMFRKEVIPYLNAEKLQGKLKITPIKVLVADSTKDQNEEGKPYNPNLAPRMGLVCYFEVEELWAIK
jgi:hypothetical protein